jgi:hypothetical protein
MTDLLCHCCKQGDLETLKVLINYNSDYLHYVDKRGLSLLYYAATSNQTHIVQYLCQRGLRDPVTLRMVQDADMRQLLHSLHFEPSSKERFKRPKREQKIKDPLESGDICFKCCYGEEPVVFRSYLILVLARWKRFPQIYMIDDKEDAENEILRKIHEYRTGDNTIEIQQVKPQVLESIVRFINTGVLSKSNEGVFAERCYFNGLLYGTSVNQQKLSDVMELYTACLGIGYDELAEYIKYQIQYRGINVGFDSRTNEAGVGLEIRRTSQLEAFKREYKARFEQLIFKWNEGKRWYNQFYNPPKPVFVEGNYDASIESWMRNELDNETTRMASLNRDKWQEDMKRLMQIDKKSETSDDSVCDLQEFAIRSMFNVRLVALPSEEISEEIIYDSSVLCNREHLCWRVDYFRAAMNGNFYEAEQLRTSSEELPIFSVFNISEQGLEKLVTYLYSGTIKLDVSTAVEIMFQSVSMEEYTLQEKCQDFIISGIGAYENSALDILLMADMVVSREMYRASMGLILRE